MTVDLLELERLYTEATPKPWVNGNSYESIISVSPEAVPIEPAYGGTLIAESLFRPGDRKLVIALHAAFPEMVKELRVMRERILNLESEIEAMGEGRSDEPEQ